jgi:hypothetical protein
MDTVEFQNASRSDSRLLDENAVERLDGINHDPTEKHILL